MKQIIMNIQTLRSAFTDVLENAEMNEALISKYFSIDYVHYVNGKTIIYDDFVKHIQVLKNNISQTSISIQSIAASQPPEASSNFLAQRALRNPHLDSL